jgi:hypothetical protein
MYDIDWVREAVRRVKEDGRGNPRVHPNGFIQVDLIPAGEDWHASYQQGHSGATLRLHIWNPADHELPHQETVNEIHDHVFDMQSTVVRGQLQQMLYGVLVGTKWHNTHELYRAVYDKASSSRLEPLGVKGVLKTQSGFTIDHGETYTQPAFTLHDSIPYELGPVVTVMQKTVVYSGFATVVCPIDIPPDNAFDRAAAAPEDYLWSAIEASIA